MRIDEHVKDAREDEARENARKLFANGVSYEIVHAYINILSDQELQEIYHEVCEQ